MLLNYLVGSHDRLPRSFFPALHEGELPSLHNLGGFHLFRHLPCPISDLPPGGPYLPSNHSPGKLAPRHPHFDRRRLHFRTFAPCCGFPRGSALARNGQRRAGSGRSQPPHASFPGHSPGYRAFGRVFGPRISVRTVAGWSNLPLVGYPNTFPPPHRPLPPLPLPPAPLPSLDRSPNVVLPHPAAVEHTRLPCVPHGCRV